MIAYVCLPGRQAHLEYPRGPSELSTLEAAGRQAHLRNLRMYSLHALSLNSSQRSVMRSSCLMVSSNSMLRSIIAW